MNAYLALILKQISYVFCLASASIAFSYSKKIRLLPQHLDLKLSAIFIKVVPPYPEFFLLDLVIYFHSFQYMCTNKAYYGGRQV